jgi:hypothetical protein
LLRKSTLGYMNELGHMHELMSFGIRISAKEATP